MFRNDEINMGMQGCRKLRKKVMMDIKDKGYIKRESIFIKEVVMGCTGCNPTCLLKQHKQSGLFIFSES